MKVFIVLIDASSSDSFAGGPCIEPDCICSTEERAKERVKTLRSEFESEYGYEADKNMFTYESWPVL